MFLVSSSMQGVRKVKSVWGLGAQYKERMVELCRELKLRAEDQGAENDVPLLKKRCCTGIGKRAEAIRYADVPRVAPEGDLATLSKPPARSKNGGATKKKKRAATSTVNGKVRGKKGNKTNGKNRTVLLRKRIKNERGETSAATKDREEGPQFVDSAEFDGPKSYARDVVKATVPVYAVEIRKIAPYYNVHSGKIRDDIPPVVIRTMLLEMYDEDIATQMFPAWVGSEFGAEGTMQHAPWKGVDAQYTWNPLQLEGEEWGPEYTIYCTLVNRIDWLQDMFDQWRDTCPKLGRQIALWQDSHHMLSLYIEGCCDFTERCTDAELRRPIVECDDDAELESALKRARDFIGEETAESDDFLPGVYDVMKPSVRFIMHQGELPNLSNLLDDVGFWQESQREEYDILDKDMMLLVDIFRKALLNPHQGRMFFSSCAQSMILHPRIWKCLSSMLFCSMAGLYERDDGPCNTVSNFWVRHELYRCFCYEQERPRDLARWMYGFQYQAFRDDFLRRHAVEKKDGARGENCRRSLGIDNKSEVFRYAWKSGCDAPVHIMDAQKVSEIDPQCFSGKNNALAMEGCCNMTDFIRMFVCEYIHFMFSNTPSQEWAFRKLYWWNETYGRCVEVVDTWRRIMNAMFEGASENPDQAEDQDSDQWIWTGASLIYKLGMLYVPCLKDKWEALLEALDIFSAPRSGGFQRFVMAKGLVGNMIWGSSIAVLLEAIAFDSKKDILPYVTRLMKEGFLVHVNKLMIQRDVKLSLENGSDGDPEKYKGFLEMRKVEKEVPAAHYEFIELFVQYCCSRAQYGDFNTWNDDEDAHMRPIDEALKRFVDAHHLDLRLERSVSSAAGVSVPLRCSEDLAGSWMPHYACFVTLFGLDMHPVYTMMLAEHHYVMEVENMAVKNTLDMMLAYPRTYIYLKWYFRCLKRCMDIRTYALPRDITEMQISQWHQSHDPVKEGEPPPLHADVVYYCRWHMDLKKPFVEEGGPTQYHHGVINITLDPETMEMFCRAPNPITKKRADVGYIKSLRDKGKKIKSSAAQTRFFDFHSSVCEMINCSKTPLQKQHSFGCILKLGKDVCVMCPLCGGYTYMAKERFNTPVGLCCSRCSSIVRRVWEQEMVKCLKYRCNVCPSIHLYNANAVHRLVVWDDTMRLKPTPFWRVIYLCKLHYHSSIRGCAEFISLDKLQLFISKMLIRYTVFTGDDEDADGGSVTLFRRKTSTERITSPWDLERSSTALQNVHEFMKGDK